uniref:Uncharacterized protein n=1 Tax=Coccolithus braarudii TaxID=221442 RepID=A0A7S0Q8F7_9EUKA|mmetsp:Transcript_46788/g.99810  ORF Transcript_46788/g.99810 Transcript_46788/m.99810 type:complete len:372 (+) Transcript_46788:302-1417(+)
MLQPSHPTPPPLHPTPPPSHPTLPPSHLTQPPSWPLLPPTPTPSQPTPLPSQPTPLPSQPTPLPSMPLLPSQPMPLLWPTTMPAPATFEFTFHRPRPYHMSNSPWAKSCSCCAASTSMVSAEEAEAAILLAAEEGMAKGVELALEESESSIRGAVVDAVVDGLISRVEDRAQYEVDLEEAIATALSAVKATSAADLEAAVQQARASAEALAQSAAVRVKQLEQQIGGGNWLTALGKAKKTSAGTAHQAKSKAEARAANPNPKLHAAGELLRTQCQSDAAVRAAILHDELNMAAPTCAKDIGLTEIRVDQMLLELEKRLFDLRFESILASLIPDDAADAECACISPWSMFCFHTWKGGGGRGTRPPHSVCPP